MAAFPTFAVGVGSMWWNKHIHGAKHFTTWHGLLGAIAVVWMVRCPAPSMGIHQQNELTQPARSLKLW